MFLMYAFGVYMIFSFIVIIVFMIDTFGDFAFFPIMGAISVVVFAIAVVMHCGIFSILRGVLQFIFLTPTYVNIFLIYANSNIHDCTWGNRPDTLNKGEQIKEITFKAYRTKWLLVWILCNATFAYVFYTLFNKGSEIYVIIILMIGFVTLFIRFGGSVVYFFQEINYQRKPINMEALNEPYQGGMSGQAAPLMGVLKGAVEMEKGLRDEQSLNDTGPVLAPPGQNLPGVVQEEVKSRD